MFIHPPMDSWYFSLSVLNIIQIHKHVASKKTQIKCSPASSRSPEIIAHGNLCHAIIIIILTHIVNNRRPLVIANRRAFQHMAQTCWSSLMRVKCVQVDARKQHFIINSNQCEMFCYIVTIGGHQYLFFACIRWETLLWWCLHTSHVTVQTIFEMQEGGGGGVWQHNTTHIHKKNKCLGLHRKRICHSIRIENIVQSSYG